MDFEWIFAPPGPQNGKIRTCSGVLGKEGGGGGIFAEAGRGGRNPCDHCDIWRKRKLLEEIAPPRSAAKCVPGTEKYYVSVDSFGPPRKLKVRSHPSAAFSPYAPFWCASSKPRVAGNDASMVAARARRAATAHGRRFD